jgi:hypothetical protein
MKMAIVLALPGRPPIEIESETITIGRESGSTVAFPGDDKISVHHAVIRKVAGRWLVEARESDFLQVGNAAPARVNWLSPGDVIRLAENGPEIIFQPQTKPLAKPTPIAAPVQPAPRNTASPPTSVPIAKPVPIAPSSRPPALPEPVDNSPIPFPIEVVELEALKRPAPTGDGPLVRPVPLAGSVLAAVPRAQPRRKSRVLPVVANLIALAGVLATAAWILFGRDTGGGGAGREPRAPQPETANSGHSSKKTTPAPETRAASLADSPAADPSNQKAGLSEPRRARKPSPVELQNSLSAVFVRDAEGKRLFRLGTAWTASRRRLVTSGAVVIAIEDLQRAGLTAIIYPAATNTAIKVQAGRVHPAYRQAVADASAARKDLDKLGGSSSAADAGKSDDSAPERIQAARDQLARAYESQSNFDLGVLETDQDLHKVLAVSSATLKQPAEARFVLAGWPFQPDEYHPAVFSQAERPVQCAGKAAPNADPASAGMRLTLEFFDELDTGNWSGSPVLNETGQVVGVYSRPAGRPDEESAELQAHAVTWIGRLREFVADLK